MSVLFHVREVLIMECKGWFGQMSMHHGMNGRPVSVLVFQVGEVVMECNVRDGMVKRVWVINHICLV